MPDSMSRQSHGRSSSKYCDRRRSLRARWRRASLAGGWPFPSDWACEGIDRVCDTVLAGDEPDEGLAELGAARARAGIGLDETLRDLAALHAVCHGEATGSAASWVPVDCDSVPSRHVRQAALGWADAVAGQSVDRQVTDALTGLVTVSYLRMRLHEIYCRARREHRSTGHVLLVVSLALPDECRHWSRSMAVVLAADTLRGVFDGGETLALVRESTPVVLGGADENIAQRAADAERLIADRMLADPELANAAHPRNGPVRVRRQELPADYATACELLPTLA